jgi:hypothetical protein
LYKERAKKHCNPQKQMKFTSCSTTLAFVLISSVLAQSMQADPSSMALSEGGGIQDVHLMRRSPKGRGGKKAKKHGKKVKTGGKKGGNRKKQRQTKRNKKRGGGQAAEDSEVVVGEEEAADKGDEAPADEETVEPEDAAEDGALLQRRSRNRREMNGEKGGMSGKNGKKRMNGQPKQNGGKVRGRGTRARSAK